ncbi:MAG: Rrf2 family transcriptional regulator [Clostridiales bacterium]|nr:Rrf2 family transcriptional regulator [Clostridiales bacterium]
MRISTKGRYALSMMVDLAQHQEDGYVSLRDVAERQGISKKYLEQIVLIFNRSGVLKTSRGFQGGYRLARSPGEYTVGEILRITENGLSPVPCVDENAEVCERSAVCPTLPIWQGLNRVINDYLDGITLQNLLEQYQASNEAVSR